LSVVVYTTNPRFASILLFPRTLSGRAARTSISLLGLPFVAVDLALRTDDVWRVIELGDGQVSDRPPSNRKR
jgi:hypothetical protein